MPTQMHIPADVVATVLDALVYEHNQRAALSTCRLVSRQWDRLACPLLFRTIKVTFDLADAPDLSEAPKRMSTLLSFLDSKPTLASYIRSILVVNNCWKRRWLTDAALYCTAPITMDDLFKMLSLLPNLRDLHLNQICPPEGLHVDPPWLVRKFSLRSLFFSGLFGIAGHRDTCVSEVLGLFESVRDLLLNTSGSSDHEIQPGSWTLPTLSSAYEPPTSSFSTPESPHSIQIMKIGTFHLGNLLIDPELSASFRGVRHLGLSYFNSLIDEVSGMNRLLTLFPALESFEIRTFDNVDAPLDDMHGSESHSRMPGACALTDFFSLQLTSRLAPT